MITILPDEDYMNCPLIKSAYSPDTIVFTAKDGEEYLGFGAVEMHEDYAEISAVETAEGMEGLEHGIFKSLLNFVERRGIYDCICAPDKPLMLKRLGFSEAEGAWKEKTKSADLLFYLNLKGYFEKHC